MSSTAKPTTAPSVRADSNNSSRKKSSTTSLTLVKIGNQAPKIVRRRAKTLSTFALPADALEPLKIERSGRHGVWISELQGPDNFWLQLKRNDADLGELQQALKVSVAAAASARASACSTCNSKMLL